MKRPVHIHTVILSILLSVFVSVIAVLNLYWFLHDGGLLKYYNQSQEELRITETRHDLCKEALGEEGYYQAVYTR